VDDPGRPGPARGAAWCAVVTRGWCTGRVPLPVVVVLGGAGMYVRIRAEERQLTKALGTEYEQFAARRKRLVPGVW